MDLFYLTGSQNPEGDVASVNINVVLSECKTKLHGEFTNKIKQELLLQGINPESYGSILVNYNNDPVNCPVAAAAQVPSIGSKYAAVAWFPDSDYFNVEHGLSLFPMKLGIT